MSSTTAHTATYFTKVADEEHSKFQKSCEIWNKVLEEGTAPEDVQGDILCAIGQANLFQNKRLKQFKDLIELHRDESAEKKATESDLAGFWDMIYHQVEDVHKRFNSLESMRSRNWESEEKPEITNSQKSASVKKPKVSPIKDLHKKQAMESTPRLTGKHKSDHKET